jgi:abhydrolase domain-containing protein 1/3
MPFVASPQKPADVAGGDESGSGLPLPEGAEANSDAGSNEDPSGSFESRSNTPAEVSERAGDTDDDTGSRASETRGEDTTSPDDATCVDDGESKNERARRSFRSRAFRYAARTATGFVKTAANAVGLGFVLGRVLDATRADERCVPFLVHGGEALTSELIEKCPSLFGAYVPPSWCVNPHAQTLIGYGRMLTLFLKYDRQLVRCEDGGQVALDWLVSARFKRGDAVANAARVAWRRATDRIGTLDADPRRESRPSRRSRFAARDPVVTASSVPEASTLPLDAPVFIMLHGINGGSHEGPTKWAIATAAARGWRCVALNLRGCGGAALASPKVYCAASSSDVRAAVDACHALYPAARILLSAYSLGTYIVGTYLAEEDCKPGGAARRGVAGAVLTSCPMEPHSSYAGLSDPGVPSGLMYNGAIAAKLREYFYKHSEAIHEHPEVDAKELNIAAMRTVADFERAVIVTTHGFKDVDEYYEYFSPARIVPAIRTPTLYVVARDDPFLGQTEGIERAVRESNHVALAHVARGGHVAFLEKGVGVFGQCWTDRVTGEFLQAALDPRSDAAEAAAKSAGAPTTVIARNIPNIAQKRIVARTSIVDAVDEDDDRSTPGDAAKLGAKL